MYTGQYKSLQNYMHFWLKKKTNNDKNSETIDTNLSAVTFGINTSTAVFCNIKFSIHSANFILE